jgi:hypothetical protein
LPGERQGRLPGWRATMRPAPPGDPSRHLERRQGVAPPELQLAVGLRPPRARPQRPPQPIADATACPEIGIRL